MMKLFALCACVALASAGYLDKFENVEWYGVKLFAEQPVQQVCEPMQVIPQDQFAQCGSNDKVQYAKLQIGKYFVNWPIMIVNTHDEVVSSLNMKCTSEGKQVGHYVFQVINDDNFLMYFTNPGLSKRVLISKTVPTEADLDSHTAEWAKEHNSFTICTTEIMNGGAKVTTGPKWWHFKKVE